jgi:hypothetical protein
MLREQDLPATQDRIIDWCDRKVAALTEEYKEAQANLEHAKAMKWKHSGFSRLANKLKKQIVYYGKIAKAVADGYMIVPNFPEWSAMEVFAVRTDRPTPALSHSAVPSANLPPGDGRYVSPRKMLEEVRRTEKDGNRMGTDLVDAEFMDVEFPVSKVRPEIIEATQRAMASRLFDRLGVVRQQGDPMVIGEVMFQQGYSERKATFFVAWWLDLEDL